MNAQRETLPRAMEALDFICRNLPASAPPPGPVLPIVDPFAWTEDFHKWAPARCVYHDRCFGGIGALHRDFCEWVIAHDEVPCTRQTFERLLNSSGFLFSDGLVSSLVLRKDLDGVRIYPTVDRALC